MITPEEFKARWGKGLVRNTEAALTHIRIPEASKRFLAEAGLPAEAHPGLQFARYEDELPTMLEAFPKDGLPADYARFRPIGVDYATIICLDEQDGGHLYSVDIEGHGLPTCFMNSSVPQLAEFLLTVRVVPREGPPRRYTDAEADAYTEELAQKFRQIDPEAMSDEKNYWCDYLLGTLI